MNHAEIIQNLINKNGFTRYIEIGVEAGHCFNSIICKNKIGIDPDETSAATHHMTSDAFFKHLKQTDGPQKFDIFWVDGLHEAPQVERDILNALTHLNEGGYILCHDLLPTDKLMQEIPRKQDIWTGNCWEAFVKLRMERNDLVMRVVDTDYGCGIITKCAPGEEASLLKIDGPIDYEGYQLHRDKWLNIISVGDFRRVYLNEL